MECVVLNGVVSGLAESKQIIYKTILTEAKELKESLKQVREQLSNRYEEFKNIHRLKSLLEDYNDLRTRFLNRFMTVLFESLYNPLPHVSTNFLQDESSTSLKVYLSQQDADIAISEIERAERGCSMIISVCEDLIRPKIPSESIDQLNQLRSEAKRIEKDLLADDMLLADNIRKAIEEYEQGHFLASALIASRVIRYDYEKIPSQGTTKDQYQQKLQTLIKMGVVDKDREDEQRLFLRASLRARDYLSHNAKIFPQVEEALSLISAAVTFCRYFIILSRLSNN